MGLFWDLIQQSQLSEQSSRASSLEQRVEHLERDLAGTRKVVHVLLERLESLFDNREPLSEVEYVAARRHVEGRKVAPHGFVHRLLEGEKQLERPTHGLTVRITGHQLIEKGVELPLRFREPLLP